MNEMRREPLTRDEVEYWCNEVDCSGILQFTAEALLNHDAAQREQLRALAARLAASERELEAIRDTVGDTGFSLRQQLAEAQQHVARLREALQLIANSVYTDAAPPELRAQNERVCCLAQQALRETGAR